MPQRPSSDTAPAGERWLARWILLILRVTQIVLIAWIVMQIRLPVVDDWLPLKAPMVSLVSVILIGKTIYDTLFYDRFRP